MKKWMSSLALLMMMGVTSGQVLASDSGIGKATGSVTGRGKCMNIKSCTSRWDSSKRRLDIYLYPFQIAAKDMAIIRQFEGNPGMVMLNQQSPDPRLWADWCPYVMVTFTFKPDATYTPSAISDYCLNFVGWNKDGETTALMIPAVPYATNHVVALSFLPGTQTPASLTLRTQDTNAVMSGFAFDVSVTTMPIDVSKKK